MTDPALGHFAAAMWSRYEDRANDTRVSAECSPSRNRRITRRVTAQSLRGHQEQRVSTLIAARADQGVRAQAAHAVSENNDMSCGEIVIVRIDVANRLFEFLAQPERVEQHRRARAVQEVQT